jgi:hypothetical protein
MDSALKKRKRRRKFCHRDKRVGMNLENIMLGERARHRKTNATLSHLYVKSETVKLIEAEKQYMISSILCLSENVLWRRC